MTKYIILFVLLSQFFFINTSFSQGSKGHDSTTTIQDALDFIKANFEQKNKAFNTPVSNAFTDYFYTREDYVMNYDYDGAYTYEVVSANNCVITIVETLASNTKISYSEDDEKPESTPIYSVFGYLSQDTVRIDFSKISRVESDRSSISFYTFNNMNLIEHNGRITQTPPKKRKNDLLTFFKEEDDELYKKTKKFLKDNKFNYDVFPDKVETISYTANKFTVQNIDRERCKRLAKAFTFLQQNCGVPKEKF